MPHALMIKSCHKTTRQSNSVSTWAVAWSKLQETSSIRLSAVTTIIGYGYGYMASGCLDVLKIHSHSLPSYSLEERINGFFMELKPMKQVFLFIALMCFFTFISSVKAEDFSSTDQMFAYEFPASGGWHQLQETTSYRTVCETGGPACVVVAGEYSLLTFFMGEVLKENIRIGPDADESHYPFTMNDGVITFKNNDLYQVQYQWEGRGEAPLQWNTVTVINLTTGQRFENIQVSVQSEVVEDATTQKAVDQIVQLCGSSVFNTTTEPPQDLTGVALVSRGGYLNEESGVEISETVTFYQDSRFMIESYPLNQGFECTELPCTSPSAVINYTSFSGIYHQDEDVFRFDGIDSGTGINVSKVYVIRKSTVDSTAFEVSMQGVCRSEFIK